MSKMGSGMVEDKFKYIPKDIIDYKYSSYSDLYTIYFFNGAECTVIEDIGELDMLIIADSLERLRED